MTSASPSLSRSFTGDLDLADAPVAVSVVFAEGSVRLLLGGDTVGAWPLSEVQFVPAGSGYQLVAEGDSLPFVPHDRDAFASFVRSEPIEEPAPSFEPAEDSEAAEAGGVSGFDVRPAGLRAEDEPGFYAGLEPEFAALDEDPPSLLDLDDEPDEFFAAGLNGPPSERIAPTFRSPLFGAEPHGDEQDAEPSDGAPPHEEAAATPESTGTQGEPAVPDVDEELTPSFRLGPFEGETPPPVNGQGNLGSSEQVNGYHPEADGDIAEPPGLPPDPAGTPIESTTPARALPADQAPELTTRPHESPYDEPERAEDLSDVPPPALPDLAPSTDGPEYVPDDPVAVDVPDAVADETSTARGFLGRFRERASRSKGPEVDELEQSDDGATFTEDDTPQPIDDAENLRQWGLVAAGGLVITVVAVMVIWGLASILGGDGDPVGEETPATTVATAPPETAPPPEPTTPTVVPTSASPENLALAQAFVSDWNSLASQYANQLTISADSLPITVAPEPTIQLNYEEDGILRLSMAPRGNGNDRDILLAMGLAIAWADSGVSPEGRKTLLAELGVDVDDPVLTDMGGEVSRSGITYRTTVDEAILTFEVDPTG